MSTANFERCDGAYEKETDNERYLRRIDSDSWISVLYRLTGFGYYEWETALCFLHPVEGRERTWKDLDCLIIAGDRRNELNDMPKEQLRDWYARNITGNRNSMETILEAAKRNDN